ncbi:MAG: tetratricopeptide repeat protein [Candidatus Dormibacteraeota bacterium]|nr:tetratricopeptide repeat protein [Candidatus Dormibacteraeota bacterium]
MTCPVCGNPLPAGARFCPNCGTAVESRLGTEERKVVTVLFADLVDSTGLAQRLDPERARDILGRFFAMASSELRALRGRPEKFIGDAVMAVFGVPQLHEDDAVRAVHAGLAIRARTRRLGQEASLPEALEVRVGIESGEAATGIGPSGQLLVTGPVVNAAARLQSAARPGQVLAGRTTHALTEPEVRFGRSRRVRARGFEGTLTGFPVEGLTPRSTRRTIPFVGRGSEQEILGHSLGLANSTARPVLVTVIGEPGMGKSRLADELAAGVGAGVLVLRGRERSFTDTATFAPIATMVGDLAGIDAGGSPEKVRRALRALAAGFSDPSDVDRLTERLALLFGLPDRHEESTFVHSVQAGFVGLVDGLARDHPLILVFEDAHGLKAPMLDLIERLGTRGEGGTRRLLVLALARNELLERRPGWGSGSENAVLIRLEPLSAEESILLVRHAGGGRIEEAQAAEIARRAGGNPYFIIETTGMLTLDGGGAGGSRLAVPPTVQAVIGARLDHLPPRLRDLTRRLAVFVSAFDLDELAVVDTAATREELTQLEEAEVLVREERDGVAPRWRLRHATFRDVAYASLPKRERLRLHQQVAERLQRTGHPMWAADHLELAALASLDLDPQDRGPAERAADALLVAGDRARRRMESRPAIDFYERALAMAGPEEAWGRREARVLAGMGEARYWLSEYPAAREVLERAVAVAEACGDQFSLALAWRFLGDIALNVEADADKAESLLQRSLVAAEALGDPWAVVRTLLFVGWVPWTRHRYEDAEAIWLRTLSMIDAEDRWARVRALSALSINRMSMEDLGRSLELIQEAGELAEETGDRFSFAVTAVQKGRVFEDLGRLEESVAWLDRGISIFTELGARWELADARAERGIAKRELGRLDEAEEDLRYAIRLSQELGEHMLAGWAWRAFARLAERRGDYGEAEERYRRSREADAEAPH